MYVDPSDAAPVELPVLDQCDYFPMRNCGRLYPPLIIRQKLLAASAISDQQFPIDKLVSGDLVQIEQAAQFLGERRAVGKGPNPDGSVHQNH